MVQGYSINIETGIEALQEVPVDWNLSSSDCGWIYEKYFIVFPSYTSSELSSPPQILFVSDTQVHTMKLKVKNTSQQS